MHSANAMHAIKLEIQRNTHIMHELLKKDITLVKHNTHRNFPFQFLTLGEHSYEYFSTFN